MRNYMRLAMFIGGLSAMVAGPSLAQTSAKSKPQPKHEDGVQRAIAYQRAKDRADAAQARKEARNPERFTYAQPQRNSEDGLANEQKRETLERNSEDSADRQAQPPRQ